MSIDLTGEQALRVLDLCKRHGLSVDIAIEAVEIGRASPPPEASERPAPVRQQGYFHTWAAERLVYEPDALVTADALLVDFSEACRAKGLAVPTPTWFFIKMSDLAKESGGRVAKFKNSTMKYRGVRLRSGSDQ